MSSTRCPAHRPSEARKVGKPLSALMPAPVRTKTRSDGLMEIVLMICFRIQGFKARFIPDPRQVLQHVQLVAPMVKADLFYSCRYSCEFHLFRQKLVVIFPVLCESL